MGNLFQSGDQHEGPLPISLHEDELDALSGDVGKENHFLERIYDLLGRAGKTQQLFNIPALGAARSIEGLGHGVLQPLLENGRSPIREASQEHARAREGFSQRLQEDSPIGNLLSEILGSSLALSPLAVGAAPKALEGASKLRNIAQSGNYLGKEGAKFGGIHGAANYADTENGGLDDIIGQKLINAGVEGGVGYGGGAALPFLGAGAAAVAKAPVKGYEALERLSGSRGGAIKDILKSIPSDKQSQTLSNYNAAGEHGFTLSPGEASQSDSARAIERGLGINPENAHTIQSFREGQGQFRKDSLEALLDEVYPTSRDALSKTQTAAQRAIQEAKSTRAQAAEPHYAVADTEVVPVRDFESLINGNSVVDEALENVLKNKNLKTELDGYRPNSIKVLNEVKKHLRDNAEEAMRKGRTSEAARYSRAESAVRDVAKQHSQEYASALEEFSKHSPKLENLEEGAIGQIANLPSNRLGKAINQVFDPNNEASSLSHVRDVIYEQDESAWRGLVRRAMEKRAQSAEGSKNPSDFYKKVLAQDDTFDMFQNALKNDPDAQHRMEGLRHILRLVENNKPPKGFESQGKDAITKDAWSGLKRLFKGNYDEALIDVITDGRWATKLASIFKEASTRNAKSLTPKNIWTKKGQANYIPQFIKLLDEASKTRLKSSGLSSTTQESRK